MLDTPNNRIVLITSSLITVVTAKTGDSISHQAAYRRSMMTLTCNGTYNTSLAVRRIRVQERSPHSNTFRPKAQRLAQNR